MIACAFSLGPYKKILYGSGFKKLPNDVQAAITSHEEGHLHGHHTELRILCLLFMPFMLKWLCQKQEVMADRYAVSQGHAIGLLKLLKSEYGGDFFSPSHAHRRNMIALALPTLRAQSTGSA